MGAQLGEDLRRTEARLQSANDVITIVREDVSFLRAELACEWSTIQNLNRALAAITPSDPASRTKTQELPAPPKYNGDRARLKGWKNSVSIKLNGDAAKFPDEQHKMSYVYVLLARKATD